MPLSQQVLSQRLHMARKNVALTQQTVAEHLGLPRESIAQIEAGVRQVNSLEIARLAKLYGRSLSSLLGEDDSDEDQPLAVLFRMQESLGEDPGLRAKLVEILNLFQESRTIEGLMGDEPRSLPPDYGIRDPQNIADAHEMGQDLARQERQRLGLGTSPIPDMAEVIAREGSWAVSTPMPDAVSGISLFHPSIGVAVLVNGLHGRNRRRFSYAHEYAHVLADRHARTASVSSASNARELIERRANSFASEFLIPARGVEELLERIDKGGRSRETLWFFDAAREIGESTERRNAPGSQEIEFHDVAYVADWFQVSYQAALYRLGDLGKVSRERLPALLDQRESVGASIGAREEPQRQLEAYVRWLASEAYRREAISGGRFREFVALAGLDPVVEYERVWDRFGN